jgi:hypothetical protein
VALVTIVLPFSPVADRLGLQSMSSGVLVALATVTGGYLFATEVLKHWFGHLLVADGTETDGERG